MRRRNTELDRPREGMECPEGQAAIGQTNCLPMISLMTLIFEDRHLIRAISG
jgi:hypothetical protein